MTLRLKLLFWDLSRCIPISFVLDASSSTVLSWLKFQEIDPPASHHPSYPRHCCELSSLLPQDHLISAPHTQAAHWVLLHAGSQNCPFSWQIYLSALAILPFRCCSCFFCARKSHKPTYLVFFGGVFFTSPSISPCAGYQQDLNFSFWVTILLLFKYHLRLQQSWLYYLLVAKKDGI